MDALSISDIFRVIFGLVIMVLNLISLVILFKCRKMAFQIRTLTIQLAITDVVSGLLTSMVGLRISTYSFVTCRLSYHAHSVVSIMTAFTITTMAGDRFLALCFPFQYHRMVTSRRVGYLSAVLWILSLFFSLMTLIWMETPDYKECNYLETIGRSGYTMYATLWGIVIFLNVLFYTGITKVFLCKDNNSRHSDNERRHNRIGLQKVILAKMLAITGLFVLTNLPALVMMMIMAVDYDNRKKYFTVYFIFVLVSMTNSILNPVIYVWRYPECRFTLLIYCSFWNQDRQTMLKNRLHVYNATYNIASAPVENSEGTDTVGTSIF